MGLGVVGSGAAGLGPSTLRAQNAAVGLLLQQAVCVRAEGFITALSSLPIRTAKASGCALTAPGNPRVCGGNRAAKNFHRASVRTCWVLLCRERAVSALPASSGRSYAKPRVLQPVESTPVFVCVITAGVLNLGTCLASACRNGSTKARSR